MAAAMSQKRTQCDYTQEPVAIRVGRKEKIFKLNPTILSNNSKFFQKALSDSWKQLPFKNTFFNLADVKVETFHHYANWCHHGNFDLILDDVVDSQADERGHCRRRLHALTEIYLLADVLDDKALRNAIMDRMLHISTAANPDCTHTPNADTIALAFSNLPETSMLARFMVDEALSGTTHPQWLDEHKNELPSSYLKVLLLGWAKSAYDKRGPPERPGDVVQYAPCTYHEHDDEVPQGEKCTRVIEMAMKPPAPKALVKRKKGSRMLDLA